MDMYVEFQVSDAAGSPISAWPLIRLAAVCSEEAYGAAVKSSARRRTALERTLVSQRLVLSQGKVVVVALPGTKGFRDWMVNLKNRPRDPKDILGQQNLCHAGFLNASRSLIGPLATSLAKYEDKSTLLFTGHSAGAATASLLYAHVLSKATSRLATVVKDFPNVHCILFGCPPISVHPLQHHTREDERSSNSLFLSFLNDGDPIIKADAGYLVRRLGWSMSTPSDARFSGEDWKGKEMAPVMGPSLKPSIRLFVHSGSTFLLALDIGSPLATVIKEVSNDELDEEAAMSWRVHGIRVYKARIESCQAIHGCDGNDAGCQDIEDSHIDDVSTRTCVKEWAHLLPIMFL